MNVNDISSRDAISAGVKKKYLVLYPDGNELLFDLNSSDSTLSKIEAEDKVLAGFIKSELPGKSEGRKPISIDLMRKLELVDYEPASDAGHFRFYPAGSMLLDILSEWANEIAVHKFGAMKIETPIIYDWNQKDIREQGESFHERHYLVKVKENPKKEWVLRFAGDFGLFRMMRDLKISHRHLPLRVYELSKSFRYERSGELSGLKRLRQFTMPDVHSFTKSLDDGWKEYIELYKHYDDLAQETHIEYAIVFRVVEAFYDKNRDRIIDMIRYSGRPAFVELLSEMKHYWVIKHEFQGVDSSGGSCQLSTVQLDVVDSSRYGIMYTDSDGKEKGCVICHSSIGSLERWIHMILESSNLKQRPTLPFWLSPVQIRIVPLKEDLIGKSVQLQKRLADGGFRSDIDDREITMQKKIMISQQNWIPVVIVLGEKEVENGMLSVTIREKGNTLQIQEQELIEMLLEKIQGKPSVDLRMPVLLSKRPKFYG